MHMHEEAHDTLNKILLKVGQVIGHKDGSQNWGDSAHISEGKKGKIP